MMLEKDRDRRFRRSGRTKKGRRFFRQIETGCEIQELELAESVK